MKTPIKILLWTCVACLISLAVYAANPSFTDFNTSDFSTTGNKVRFNPGMTNYWTSLAGSGIVTNGGTGLGNTFTNATLWNGTNNGLAFSSPGSAPGAEQFGVLATASGTNATAVGRGSTSSGSGSLALGRIAFATGANSVAMGVNSSASHDNSYVLGQNASSTATHQIMLGTSVDTVVIPGSLQSTASGASLYTASGDATGLNISNSVGGARLTIKGTNGDAIVNSVGNFKTASYGSPTEVNFGAAGIKTNGLYMASSNEVDIANDGTNVLKIVDGAATFAAGVTATTFTGNLTGNATGTAASTTDAGTYWGAQATLGTNTLLVNNKMYYFNAANDTAITNVTVTGCWAVLSLNNTNASTTIHCYNTVAAAGIEGNLTYTSGTNGIVVAAGKTATFYYKVMSKTNYSNCVQQ